MSIGISDFGLFTSSLWIIFGFYLFFICLQLVTLGICGFIWKFLPTKFRTLTGSCIVSTCLGFLICLYFLITENSISECSVARKLAYAIFYIGFLFFDMYQILKVTAICQPTQLKKGIIYFFFLLRLSSYIYNVTIVSANVIALTPDTTFGPCTSTFTNFGIYQEHIIAIAFEVCLALIIFDYLWAKLSLGIAKTDFVKKILDFEIMSFGLYMIVECLYLVFYSMVSKSWTSLLQTFYLNVPIVLLLVNILIFYRKGLMRTKQKKSKIMVFTDVEQQKTDWSFTTSGETISDKISTSPVLQKPIAVRPSMKTIKEKKESSSQT